MSHWSGAYRRQRFIEHRLGRNFSHLKGAFGELAVGKITHRPGDAAHPVRLHLDRLEPLAQNDLGGAPANVDHQTAFVGARQAWATPW